MLFRSGNVFAVDTGAVFRELSERGGLSMVNVASRTDSLAAAAEGGMPRVAAFDDAVGHPFGQYARPRRG